MHYAIDIALSCLLSCSEVDIRRHESAMSSAYYKTRITFLGPFAVSFSFGTNWKLFLQVVAVVGVQILILCSEVRGARTVEEIAQCIILSISHCKRAWNVNLVYRSVLLSHCNHLSHRFCYRRGFTLDRSIATAWKISFRR
jgi:hypothetical protein